MTAASRKIWRTPVPIGAIAGLTALCYLILLGGTASGDVWPVLRLFNALIGAAAIGYFVLRAPGRTDRLDGGILAAVVLFAFAGALSQHPRQSLDAAVAALAWACGLFFARDQLARASLRTALVIMLMALSAVVTVTTAVRWLAVLVAWWSATGVVVPPLDLDYPGLPWGHWHDVALLCVALYPAWWIGSPTGPRRLAAVLIGGLTLLIVVVDGSRNVWLAVAAATAVVMVRHAMGRPAIVRRILVPAIVVAALAMLALAVTGLGGAVVTRALDLGPLAMRAAMWGSTVEAWLSSPFAGIGPGSFPWVLQRTNYFETNSLAPRHPDSVLFQLLPETGLLGVIAAITVLAVVVPAVMRGRSTPAVWALAVLLFAGLGANPADFGFFIALALAWVALAAPHAKPVNGGRLVGSAVPSIVIAVCLVVLLIVHGLTISAAFRYDRARDLIGDGDMSAALAELDGAVAMDPAHPLYRRQRGTLRYINGDVSPAIDDLALATRLNPADDLAWRTLALALYASGDKEAAIRAVDLAIGAQRSDVTNLLLRARWHIAADEQDAAIGLFAEIVQAWPAIVFAPAWESTIGDLGTETVIAAALRRWEQGSPSLVPEAGQGIWLSILGGRPDLLAVALSTEPAVDRLNEMILAAFTCDPEAKSLLDDATSEEKRTFLYWLLRVRASSIEGDPDNLAQVVTRLWGNSQLGRQSARAVLSVVGENDADRFSADSWGYRRLPVDWPQVEPRLPSPAAGATRWLIEPIPATHDAGLEKQLSRCSQLPASAASFWVASHPTLLPAGLLGLGFSAPLQDPHLETHSQSRVLVS